MEWKNGEKLSEANSHAPFDWKGKEDNDEEEEATRQKKSTNNSKNSSSHLCNAATENHLDSLNF